MTTRRRGDGDDVVRSSRHGRLRDYVELTGTVEELCVREDEVRALDGVGADRVGKVRCTFLGRTSIPGICVGVRLRVQGRLVLFHRRRCLLNPLYELVGPSCGATSS